MPTAATRFAAVMHLQILMVLYCSPQHLAEWWRSRLHEVLKQWLELALWLADSVSRLHSARTPRITGPHQIPLYDRFIERLRHHMPTRRTCWELENWPGRTPTIRVGLPINEMLRPTPASPPTGSANP